MTKLLTFQDALDEYWLRRPHGAEGMWDSWEHPHRTQILVALHMLPDVQTVHEIGCGSGPNLRLLQKYLPHLRLSGSEPHQGLREFALQQGLEVADITLPSVPETPADVVLSMYTLAYVEDVAKVLAGLYERGNKYLVLVEPTANVTPFEGPGQYSYPDVMSSWAHDYDGVSRSIGWRLLWRWPIIPHHQGLNVVAVYGR